jgi:hypothetical protein
MTTHTFQLKISNSLRELCRRACLQLESENEKLSLSVAQHLRTATSLNVDEVAHLEQALVGYIDAKLSNDIAARDLARSFVCVLADFRATPLEAAVQEDPAPQQAKAGLAALHRADMESFNQKRDEIFRHIFGVDADHTIWGTERK